MRVIKKETSKMFGFLKSESNSFSAYEYCILLYNSLYYEEE